MKLESPDGLANDVAPVDMSSYYEGQVFPVRRNSLTPDFIISKRGGRNGNPEGF